MSFNGSEYTQVYPKLLFVLYVSLRYLVEGPSY
jgi:hypothetical protein